VLHGSNVERLQVTNLEMLEFALETKTSGPERGRSYSFRVSTHAEFDDWMSVLQQWLDSLPQEPLPGDPITRDAAAEAARALAVARDAAAASPAGTDRAMTV